MRQLLLVATTACLALAATTPIPMKNDKTVLILGGGVAGIIAARTLAERNITDILLIEAHSELGGRMRSVEFGAEGRKATIELGANWVQGAGGGNPILGLAAEHGVRTVSSDFYGSVATYDEYGEADYLDVVEQAAIAYNNLSNVGILRASTGQVDMNSRAGYSMIGMKPETPLDMAAEYFMDWQYAQTPEQTSWIASSMVHRYTYDAEHGGFSGRNLLSIDQRGFKHLIQAESHKFLKPEQVLLNATVRRIAYSPDRVVVTLADGRSISADYVITTFSLGVLQNDDVWFRPPLPMWKVEAIHSMTMATYTKIFLQFERKFWFDTQFALYADKERGRYPVWQSLDMEGFLPGSGILFATVTGDYARRIESLSDAQVLSELLSVLQSMFPDITGGIPHPTAFFFPRWTADPSFRGSYSNWPASFVREHHVNLRANVGKRVWFAGEATSLRYFGYLHGAYLEGTDIAARVAECVISHGEACENLPFVNSESVSARVQRNSGVHGVGFNLKALDVRPFLAGVLNSVLPYSWWWWCVKAGFVP